MSIQSNTEPFGAKGPLLSSLMKKNRLKNLDPNTVRIGLIDPNIAQTWAERVLSDGTTVMSIKKGDTINHTTSQPIATGLFCQRIFGPCTDYTCACGHEKIRIHLNVNVSNPVCPECHVEWTESSVRRQRLGSISLLSPVTHKWFSDSRNYIPILTGITVKTFRTLKECKLFFPFPLQKEYGASNPSFDPLLVPKKSIDLEVLSSEKVLSRQKKTSKRKNNVPYSFLETKIFYGKKISRENKNPLSSALFQNSRGLDTLRGTEKGHQTQTLVFQEGREQEQSSTFKGMQSPVYNTFLPLNKSSFDSFEGAPKAFPQKSTSLRTKPIEKATKETLRATKNLQFLLENNGNKLFRDGSFIPLTLKEQEYRSKTGTSTPDFLGQTLYQNSFISKVSKEKTFLDSHGNNYNLTYKKILKQNIKKRLFNYLNNPSKSIKEILLKWSIVLSGGSSLSTKDYNSFGKLQQSFTFGRDFSPSFSLERKNEFNLNANFLSFLSQKGKFVNREVEFLDFLHKKSQNFYTFIATAEILKQSSFLKNVSPALRKDSNSTKGQKTQEEKNFISVKKQGKPYFTSTGTFLVLNALGKEEELFSGFCSEKGFKAYSLLKSKALKATEKEKFNFLDQNSKSPLALLVSNQYNFNSFEIIKESLKLNYFSLNLEILGWRLKEKLRFGKKLRTISPYASINKQKIDRDIWYKENSQKIKAFSSQMLKKPLPFVTPMSQQKVIHNFYYNWSNKIQKHVVNNFSFLNAKSEKVDFDTLLSRLVLPKTSNLKKNDNFRDPSGRDPKGQGPQKGKGVAKKKNKKIVALRSKNSSFLYKKIFILEKYSPKKWSKVVLNKKISFYSLNSKMFDSNALTIAKLKCKRAKTQGFLSNYNPLLVSSSVQLEKVYKTSFFFEQKRFVQKGLRTSFIPYSKVLEPQTLWLEGLLKEQNEGFFPSLKEKNLENLKGRNSTPIRPSFTQPEDYRRQFIKFIGNNGLVQSVDIPISQRTEISSFLFQSEKVPTKDFREQKKQKQTFSGTSIPPTRTNNYKWHATGGPSSLPPTIEFEGINQKLGEKNLSKNLNFPKQDQNLLPKKTKSSSVQKNIGIKELYFSESKWIAKEEKVKKILSQTGGGGLQKYLGLLNLGQLVFILQNDLFEIAPRLTRSIAARRILLQIVNETYNNLNGYTLLLEKIKTKTQKKSRMRSFKGLSRPLEGASDLFEFNFFSNLITEIQKDPNLIKSSFITELSLFWFKESKIMSQKNLSVSKTKDKDFDPITPSPLFVAPFSDSKETLGKVQREEEQSSSTSKTEDFSEQILKLKLFITVKIESLEKKYKEVKKEYKTVKKICTDFQNRRNAHKRRYKLALQLFRTTSNPAGMTLSSIPVLPPGLRPIIDVPKIGPITADLNIRYRGLIFALRNLRELAYVDFRNAGAAQASVQEAVDDLLYTGGKTRKDKGVGLSPPNLYKSLAMRLKGKHGRFRGNLLGKRVDYSGRSVIVVGPTLKIHQCGLPFEIAVKLFNPFLIRRLIQKGLCKNVYKAKQILIGGKFKPVIWALCREVMLEHLVLLNRAPTLHRLGVQAFIPILISGRAILLHPLVCTGFNADFDGDQMGVHVPLFPRARAEAWKMMWSRNNFLSPSSGEPILLPSQDMVLGCYYLTEMYSDRFQYGSNKIIKEDCSSLQSSRNKKTTFALSLFNTLKTQRQKPFSHVQTEFNFSRRERDLRVNLKIRKTSTKSLVTISKKLFNFLFQSLEKTPSFLNYSSLSFIKEPYYQIQTNTVLPKKSYVPKTLLSKDKDSNGTKNRVSELLFLKNETTVAFINPWAYVAKPLTKPLFATWITESSSEKLSFASFSPFVCRQLIGSFWPLVDGSKFLNWTGSNLEKGLKLFKTRGFGTIYQKQIFCDNVVSLYPSLSLGFSKGAVTGPTFLKKVTFSPAFGMTFPDPKPLNQTQSTKGIVPPLENKSKELIEKTFHSIGQTQIFTAKMVLDKYYRGFYNLQSIVWVHLNFTNGLANNHAPQKRNNIANKLENEGSSTPTLELRINPYGITQLLQISGSKKSVFYSSFLLPTKKIVKTPFEISSIRTTVGRLLFNDILQKFEISLNGQSV